MNKITLAQREALDVVKDMIDKSNTNVPEYGTKILTLILGILNIDCRVEHTDADITDTGVGKPIPIGLVPNDGNDKIQINIPDWIKNVPSPPVDATPVPFPPQVWYNHEVDPIQTNAHEERRYSTNSSVSVSCTGDKNCITTTYNPNDVQYTGDFRDGQTSFNDK